MSVATLNVSGVAPDIKSERVILLAKSGGTVPAAH
jgi:hypothetical protein